MPSDLFIYFTILQANVLAQAGVDTSKRNCRKQQTTIQKKQKVKKEGDAQGHQETY